MLSQNGTNPGHSGLETRHRGSDVVEEGIDVEGLPREGGASRVE